MTLCPHHRKAGCTLFLQKVTHLVFEKAFPYKLAIFLICANEYSYMGYASSHLGNDPQFRWYPDYPEHQKKIGKPPRPRD